MANLEHLLILKSGNDSWKKWRRENQEIRPDLNGIDLRDVVMSYADLHEADLGGAILCETDLRYINLHSADLRKADLRGANLSAVNLKNTIIDEEQLTLSHGFELSRITQSPSRSIWRTMVFIPWSKQTSPTARNFSILLWTIGWLWALAGLFVGSAFASYFIVLLPNAIAPYHDVLVTSGAIIGGFIIQGIGLFILFAQSRYMTSRKNNWFYAWFFMLLVLVGAGYAIYWSFVNLGQTNGLIVGIFLVQGIAGLFLPLQELYMRGNNWVSMGILLIGALLPLAGAGYAIFCFFTYFGPSTGLIGRAFVFGLIAKLIVTFALPIIKTLFWSIPLGIFYRILGIRRRTVLEPIEEAERINRK